MADQELSRKGFIDLVFGAGVTVFTEKVLKPFGGIRSLEAPISEDEQVWQLLLEAGANPDKKIGGVDFKIGTHSTDPQDPNWPVIITEDSIIHSVEPQFFAQLVNKVVANRLMEIAPVPPSPQVTPQQTIDNKFPFLSTPTAKIGGMQADQTLPVIPTADVVSEMPEKAKIGMNDSGVDPTESVAADNEIVKKGVIKYKIDSWGVRKDSKLEDYLNSLRAGVELIGVELIIRKVVGKLSRARLEEFREYLQENNAEVILRIAEILNDPFTIFRHSDEKKDIIWQKVLSSAFREIAWAGASLYAGMEMSNLASHTNILGRIDMPAQIGELLDTAVFKIPEEALKHLKLDYYYILSSIVSLRNTNMALNMFRALVELTYAENIDLQNTDRVLATFGLMHAGIESEFKEGYPALLKKMRTHLNGLIDYYSGEIGKQKDSLKRQELMTYFMLIAQKLSMPVLSNGKIEINSEAVLPHNGLSLLWESISKKSGDLLNNPDRKKSEGLSLMIESLNNFYYEVAEYLGPLKEGEEQRGSLNPYNTWRFREDAPFDFIISERVRKGNLDHLDRGQAIVMQNKTPYILRVRREVNILNVFIRQPEELLFAEIPVNSDKEDWRWLIPKFKNPRVPYIV